MAEQRIEVTIDGDGRIEARTTGIKGELCLDELHELLGKLADLKSVNKTDEYHQKTDIRSQAKIKRRL